MMNQNFMDMLNIFSVILQLQNSESMQLSKAQSSIENKIDHEINKKLEIILKKLDEIEKRLGI